MPVYKLDPLSDSRWPEFLAGHPDSSVFHTAGWLQALHLTYGYRPIVFTTTQAGPLTNALVFCEVRSWLTGRRLVSLPFSDHCQPLATGQNLVEMLSYLRHRRYAQQWKYVELRPVREDPSLLKRPDFGASKRLNWHVIDLRPDIETIYRRFHLTSVRQSVKRAQRESLIYDTGTSAELLRQFGQLLLLTRRRHGLPPQPTSWFHNIVHSLGPAARLHVARKDSVPVASMLTLTHKATVVYKYACSDARFNNLGGVPFLLWTAIQQAKDAGLDTFDLGRSGDQERGLIVFKERLGAAASSLVYLRSPAPYSAVQGSPGGASVLARRALSRLPDPLFAGVGQLLYRHIA